MEAIFTEAAAKFGVGAVLIIGATVIVIIVWKAFNQERKERNEDNKANNEALKALIGQYERQAATTNQSLQSLDRLLQVREK